MRLYRYAPWLVFCAALAVMSCGTSVCVGPFSVNGNCYDQTAEGAATSGALTFVSVKSKLLPQETYTFVVQGGVAPYSFRRPTPDKGTMTSTGVYAAPNETGLALIIEVEDNANQTQTTSVIINN